jgi:hypothetical protein
MVRDNFRPSVTFISFGTSEFSAARRALVRSLRSFGYHRHALYSSKSPALRRAIDENPEIFKNPRGFGLWLWKPYIILDAMERVPSGDLLFYTDIAVRMVSAPERMIELAACSDITTFRIGVGLKQKLYTKIDTFHLLDAAEPRFYNDEMANGAFISFRSCPNAKEFLHTWLSAARDSRALADGPSAFGRKETPEFITHRHDQSILSILATRECVPLLIDPSQWGRSKTGEALMQEGSSRFVAVDFGQIFDHHRKRNTSFVSKARKFLGSGWSSKFN